MKNLTDLTTMNKGELVKYWQEQGLLDSRATIDYALPQHMLDAWVKMVKSRQYYKDDTESTIYDMILARFVFAYFPEGPSFGMPYAIYPDSHAQILAMIYWSSNE